MKPVVFSEHAKDRLRERGIEPAQVRLTLSEPHTSMPAVPPPRRRCMREFGRRMLDVIYVETGSAYVVITAVWLREEDRLRRTL